MRRPTGARPQDLNVRPAVCRWVAGNAPPLSSLLTSSECTFTQKHESAHAWEHTHSVSPLSLVPVVLYLDLAICSVT